MARHRVGAARRALLLLAAAVVTLAGLPGVAGASPDLDTAREQAQRLHRQLDELAVRAATAAEEYATVEEQLGQVVTEHLLAGRQLDEARGGVDQAVALEASTARAIYRAGGTTAMYATVLDGHDPADLLTRIRAVQTVVRGNRAATAAAGALVGGARAIEARLAGLADAQTDLQARVGAARDRVSALVARQEALLETATAEVVRLQEEQARLAAARASADAAAALAAARASAVAGGDGDVGRPDAAAVERAIAAARGQLGKPYQWGATGPDSYDCSGLTGAAYRAAGVSLPRTSRQQWFAGPHPGLGYLQPGDLLFWATDPSDPGTIHHVALYIGNDQMIAAPQAGDVVKVQGVFLDEFIGAVRPTAAR